MPTWQAVCFTKHCLMEAITATSLTSWHSRQPKDITSKGPPSVKGSEQMWDVCFGFLNFEPAKPRARFVVRILEPSKSGFQYGSVWRCVCITLYLRRMSNIWSISYKRLLFLLTVFLRLLGMLFPPVAGVFTPIAFRSGTMPGATMSGRGGVNGPATDRKLGSNKLMI